MRVSYACCPICRWALGIRILALGFKCWACGVEFASWAFGVGLLAFVVVFFVVVIFVFVFVGVVFFGVVLFGVVC